MKLNDGTILNSPEEIHHSVTSDFQDFLIDSNNVDHADLSHPLESVVMDEEYSFLYRDLDMAKVKDIVFSIPKYNTPGLDGFGSEFYMACWEIVKADDVLEAVQTFFSSPCSSRR